MKMMLETASRRWPQEKDSKRQGIVVVDTWQKEIESKRLIEELTQRKTELESKWILEANRSREEEKAKILEANRRRELETRKMLEAKRERELEHLKRLEVQRKRDLVRQTIQAARHRSAAGGV